MVKQVPLLDGRNCTISVHGYRDAERMGVIFIVVFTTLPKGAILSIE